MKLIKPYFEIIEQEAGLEGIYKMIELAGRTCYKSEKNITSDSAVKFAERMLNSGHYAMLEHGTVYLDIHRDNPLYDDFKERYNNLVDLILNQKFDDAVLESNRLEKIQEN